MAERNDWRTPRETDEISRARDEDRDDITGSDSDEFDDVDDAADEEDEDDDVTGVSDR
jgi:hypothetical protein